MSILGDILSSIFGLGEGKASEAETPQGGGPGAPTSSASMPPKSGAAKSAAAAAGAANVDVAAVLDNLAKNSREKLNWRTSIVDLMKLLKLDSSIKARKALADELHYPGDKNKSAEMNVWLHKQVMKKLAENGGVVPADLRD